MSIHDQEDLSIGLPLETAHEVNEHVRVEMAFEHAEAKPAAVGDGRHHTAATALTACLLSQARQAAWDHGGLPAHAVAAPALIVHAHAYFVFPPEGGTLLLGLLTELRIFCFQPARLRLRIALIRTRQRLLRGHAPAFQTAPHRPDRNLHTGPSGDQLCDRFPRPQKERQLELIRTPIAYLALHLPRVRRFQPGLGRTPSTPRYETLVSLGLMARQPSVDRLPRNTKHAAGLHLRHPFFGHGSNHAASQILLRFRRQRSRVSF